MFTPGQTVHFMTYSTVSPGPNILKIYSITSGHLHIVLIIIRLGFPELLQWSARDVELSCGDRLPGHYRYPRK